MNVSDLGAKYHFKITQDVPRIFHHLPPSNSTLYGDVLSNRLCFQSRKDHRNGLLHNTELDDRARADVPERVELRLSFRTADRFVRLLSWEGLSRATARLQVIDGTMEVFLICDNRRNITVRSQVQVDDDRLHSFELKRKQKKIEFYVDNALETMLPLTSCASLFSDGEVQLFGANRTMEGRAVGSKVETFRGCIGELHTRNEKLDLHEFLPRRFICDPS